ncbi:hypothetical protein [Nonomuraea sp. NPDC003804]|uniref:hypothetical protein n=1 Tax=Nonomuraea sp. NPDC003804 TaxID=3154547 RepID=UPI0033A6A196
MSDTNGVVEYLRTRFGKEADSQAHRAARSIRQWSDELASASDTGEPGSPVDAAMQEIAGVGLRAADYLDQRGFAGIVEDVKDLARRRPLLFAAGAVALGIVIGRVLASARDVSTGDASSSEVSREASSRDASSREASLREGRTPPLPPA